MAAPLNSSQVVLLQTLARLPDGEFISRADLESKAAVPASASNLGPSHPATLAEGNGEHADSLYGQGLVKPQKHEGEATQWAATAKGRKLAPTFKARKRTDDAHKVPVKVLDPIVRKFAATHPYSFELYTDADLKESRTALGEDYAAVPLADLRDQMANRRKQGVLADPADKVRKAVERAIRDFGPDGSVVAELLTAAQVKQLRGMVK